jgi:hypothetical protein
MTLTTAWGNLNTFIGANIQTYFSDTFDAISATPIDPNLLNTCIYWGVYNGNFETFSGDFQTAFVIKMRQPVETILDGFITFMKANPTLNNNAILFNLASFDANYGVDGWNTVFIDTDITLGL